MKWFLGGFAAMVLGSVFLMPHTAAGQPAGGGSKVGTNPGGVKSGRDLAPAVGHELAAFSGGCFWGTEDYFRNVKGVVATAVGYTGGVTDRPTYEDVCSHTTRHAESVLVEFDPKVISYPNLIREFWKAHDPTQMNRQGPDYGDQYRTAIWTFSKAQTQLAMMAIEKQQKFETEKIVTTVSRAPKFWIAEDYHQQYDEKTGRHSCPAPRKIGG